MKGSVSLYPSSQWTSLSDYYSFSPERLLDGMITWYEGFSPSDTHIDPFGASRIIWSTPWDTHAALQHI